MTNIFQQTKYRISAPTRFRPAPVSNTQIMGRIREECNLIDTEALWFLVLIKETLSVSGSSGLPMYNLSGVFKSHLDVFYIINLIFLFLFLSVFELVWLVSLLTTGSKPIFCPISFPVLLSIDSCIFCLAEIGPAAAVRWLQHPRATTLGPILIILFDWVWI